MGMVKETRQIFEVGDIKALGFQCRKCLGEFVVKVSDAAIPIHCPKPNCGERWTADGSTNSRPAGVVEALRKLLDFPDQLVALRFEIDGREDE